jgi:flagellar biosynthesis/type III secretory pathway chaperone
MSMSDMIEILQKQLSLYERLLVCEEEKKPLILANEVVKLNVLTQKEKLLTAQADELETSRLLMTARHFKDLGFRKRSGVLSDLIKSVNHPEEKLRLMEMHDRLTAVLTRLKQINEENQALIQQSLDFVNFSISLMVEDPNEDVVYQHPMNQAYGKKRNWYDSRA